MLKHITYIHVIIYDKNVAKWILDTTEMISYIWLVLADGCSYKTFGIYTQNCMFVCQHFTL